MSARVADTIFAVSSGPPPAAIAVLRISGPGALAAAEDLAGRLPPPRHAALRGLRDAAGALLDRALMLVFLGPATATGEDLVEFHCHGGRAVIAAVSGALGALGLRRAEPGEFTRRALMNGRIDLAQAEGLADLLEAETETQRVAALAGVEGRVGALIGGWATRAARLSAAVEASLDFADEADVGSDEALVEDSRRAMRALADDIDLVLAAPSVERLRDGARVVIAGPPNAGKSTLLNLLAGHEAAIVSPIAGTTRDRVEAPVARGGVAFLLTDTAGLAATTDHVESIGIERARAAIARADLLLWLGDEPPPSPSSIWVQSRADLPGRERLLPGRELLFTRDRASDAEALWVAIAERVGEMLGSDRGTALRERQREWCRAASSALRAVVPPDPLLLAEQLDTAHRALASAIGTDATEAMLDQLFGRFCIGK